MANNFFAYLSRMKYIERWSLMRSTVRENIMEHTGEVAILAHALATVNNTVFKGNADISKTVLYALYHESAEVITGDLPTPIKYYNKEISDAYKALEGVAAQKLLTMLPQELTPSFSELLLPDEKSYEFRLSKAADKLAAYIKCIEEVKSGNNEFLKAKRATEDAVKNTSLPEVEYFLEKFIDGYSKTLDELD